MNPQEVEMTHAVLWYAECSSHARVTKDGCEGQEVKQSVSQLLKLTIPSTDLERISRRAKMANLDWYVVKVRPGFKALVAHRLRKLDLEVFVSENATSPQEPHQGHAAGYVYCRLTPENQSSVISIPGVLDIVGTPASLDGKPSTLQTRNS